ncbi:MAG: ATP-binding cassette domain-containing protein [Helicobacteraceae bacterium]|jgi:peptide/nickel transport system ATP-binding protein|nr:ATP-binding cassette domain-containing protein [Helicobacteraceae bacterium]
MRKRILNIRDLSFGYKDRLLYEDFSLEVFAGEIVAVVGPSGCGKSTLLELIAGALQPRGGTIEAGRISQIFQDSYSSFHHSFTIESQIRDVADMTEAETLCARLCVQRELLLKKPYELSGGQLQRLSILRALLMKPELILADEPTSALDNLTQLEVMKLLISLLDQVGVLLITHDTALANWCADKIVNLA